MTYSSALDWQGHIDTGRSFLKTAGNGLARPTVFTNELIYQIAAMAIENLLVGVWQYHRQMPVDHTLDGLVDGMAHFCPLKSDMAESIKEIGRFDDMCPLVPVQKTIPGDQEIRTILAVGQHVAEFAAQHVQLPVSGT